MPSSMSPLPCTARSRAGQRRALRGADSADAASVGHRAGRADLPDPVRVSRKRQVAASTERCPPGRRKHCRLRREAVTISAWSAKPQATPVGQFGSPPGPVRGVDGVVHLRSLPLHASAVATATWPLRRPSSSARPQEAVAPRRGSRTAAQRELTVAQLRRPASRTTAACSSGAPLWLTAGRTARAPRSRRLPNCRADPGVSRARRRRCC
jgi:hypothetical protein